jgi:hypothetical protein
MLSLSSKALKCVEPVMLEYFTRRRHVSSDIEQDEFFPNLKSHLSLTCRFPGCNIEVLCCDSESMFNLIVYSSTHSLVSGAGDAIIQGRATVQRSFLFPCSSPTNFCLNNQNFFNFMLVSQNVTHSALFLLMQRRDFLNVIVLKSFHWQLAASTTRRYQRRLARFKNNFTRNPSATACLENIDQMCI